MSVGTEDVPAAAAELASSSLRSSLTGSTCAIYTAEQELQDEKDE